MSNRDSRTDKMINYDANTLIYKNGSHPSIQSALSTFFSLPMGDEKTQSCSVGELLASDIDIIEIIKTKPIVVSDDYGVYDKLLSNKNAIIKFLTEHSNWRIERRERRFPPNQRSNKYKELASFFKYKTKRVGSHVVEGYVLDKTKVDRLREIIASVPLTGTYSTIHEPDTHGRVLPFQHYAQITKR